MVVALIAFIRNGLAILAVLAMYRAFAGPTAADRILAINYVATQVILLILLSSSVENISLYVDVAMVFVLGAFIATVGIVRLLEEGTL